MLVMGYDEFATKNADYVARYGLHRKNSIFPKEVFGNLGRGVDAVVLEIRGSKVWTAGSVKKAFRKLLRGKIELSVRLDSDTSTACGPSCASSLLQGPRGPAVAQRSLHCMLQPCIMDAVSNMSIKNC